VRVEMKTGFQSLRAEMAKGFEAQSAMNRSPSEILPTPVRPVCGR